MMVGGDEMPRLEHTPHSMKSAIDASCRNGDASDLSRGATITPIIYNNIEEHKGNNTKSLPPHAAVGWRETVVPIKETGPQKKYLPIDFL
jgi:hypothetical protein